MTPSSPMVLSRADALRVAQAHVLTGHLTVSSCALCRAINDLVTAAEGSSSPAPEKDQWAEGAALGLAKLKSFFGPSHVAFLNILLEGVVGLRRRVKALEDAP